MPFWWWSWVSCHEERQGRDGTSVRLKVVKKEKIQGTALQLVSEFNSELKTFAKHVFNIRHQHAATRGLRKRAMESDTEGTIHIDFSENYTCRYSREIQSIIFGASHQQATLHTGVLYLTACDATPLQYGRIWDPYLKRQKVRNRNSILSTLCQMVRPPSIAKRGTST